MHRKTAGIKLRRNVPCDQHKLIGGAAILGGVVKVDQSVAAVIGWELGDEILESCLWTASLVDDDSGVVLDLVDDVLVVVWFSSELELIERVDHSVIDGNSGGLAIASA